MKIIFDTNVLLSSFLTTTGPSQRVLQTALKKHQVILSEYILSEFEGKLRHKFQVPPLTIHKSLSFLKQRTFVWDVPENKELYFTDKKDIPILSLIEIARPDYFVTGDKKLLHLKKIKQTLFLSPRELMEILEHKD